MTLAETIIHSLISNADGVSGNRLVIKKKVKAEDGTETEIDLGGWSRECAVRNVDEIIHQWLKGDL